MANRLERVPEIRVAQGTPAQPAEPERCVLVQVGTRQEVRTFTEVSFQSSTFADLVAVDPLTTPDLSGVISVARGAPQSSFTIDSTSEEITRLVTVPVFEERCTGGTPFIPGTPSQITNDAGPDWLSYARAQPIVPESGGYTVDIVGPLIIGLMSPVFNGSYSLGVVTYGIYYDGAEVFPVIGGVVGASLGSFSGTLSVKIERELGVYRTFIAGTQVHTTNITQDSPAALVAFLETDNGFAENPEEFLYDLIEATAQGAFGLAAESVDAVRVTAEGRLPQSAFALALVDDQMDVVASGVLPLTGSSVANVDLPTTVAGLFALTGEAEALIDGVVNRTATGALPLTGTATALLETPDTVTGSLGLVATASNQGANGGRLVASAMTMIASDSPYTSVDLSIAKQQLTAASVGSAPNVSITGAILSTSKPIFKSYMVTGGVITSALKVAKQTMFATEGPFAQVIGSVPKQRMFAFVTPGELTGVAYSESMFLFAGNTATQVGAVNLTMGELELAGDVELSVTVTAQLEAALSLTDDYSLSRMLQVLVENQVRLIGSARAPDQVDTQYLVTELSGALSRATGMQFDQFVYSGGKTYGIRKDGMYLIGATSEEMDAEADLGATTMGTSRAKNLEAAYIGMTTDGTVYLVAENDGKEKIYRATQREPTMRVRTGKGVTGRTWRLKLRVVDATEVDLEDLELVVGATRRWTR